MCVCVHAYMRVCKCACVCAYVCLCASALVSMIRPLLPAATAAAKPKQQPDPAQHQHYLGPLQHHMRVKLEEKLHRQHHSSMGENHPGSGSGLALHSLAATAAAAAAALGAPAVTRQQQQPQSGTSGFGSGQGGGSYGSGSSLSGSGSGSFVHSDLSLRAMARQQGPSKAPLPPAQVLTSRIPHAAGLGTGHVGGGPVVAGRMQRPARPPVDLQVQQAILREEEREQGRGRHAADLV